MSFTLRFLSGASLEDETGTVGGPSVQRHRLALLALLAVSPVGSVTRDKAMALLWPERDAEQARKLLNQSVYTLRRTLGQDAILSAGEELRLNAETVTCDVIAFEDAFRKGNHEEAAVLYTGPFLDGFFLSHAPEFDRWTDQERGRLAAAYAHALEELAQGAERGGDPEGAVRWWKVRAAQDPYDSRVALRLMEALVAAGNPAGAVQHAAIHERLLRDELELAPAPEVVTLADRLRREPIATPSPGDGQEISGAMESSAPRAESDVEGRRPVPEPTPRTRTSEPDADEPARRAWSPPRRYGAAAVLGALLIFAAIRLAPARSDGPPGVTVPVSIAVLPLANHSPDPADAFLAAALTDELITALAKVGDLRVTPGTSVLRFRDSPSDVRATADSLGVSHVLEGGVWKGGSDIRVSIRLVDALEGTTRWSATYEREMENVFLVQEGIVRGVVTELGLLEGQDPAAPLVRQPTRSVAAYELYLRGSDQALFRTESGIRQMEEYLRRAIALDSTYAAPYVGLAKMYMARRVQSLGDDGAWTPGDQTALAEEAVLTALALDDSLAQAHGTLGVVRKLQFDFASAERALRHAVSLDPADPWLQEKLVGVYIWTERPREALAAAERAVELDPLSPTARAELARALVADDRCDEALVQLAPLADLEPPLLRVALIAAQCYAQEGMWLEAIAELEKGWDERLPRGHGLRGYLLARAGERGEALRIRDALLEGWHAGMGDALAVALPYLGLGDLDQAFMWLERSVSDPSRVHAFGSWTLMDPIFRELHRDPRFELVRTRLGLQNR